VAHPPKILGGRGLWPTRPTLQRTPMAFPDAQPTVSKHEGRESSRVDSRRRIEVRILDSVRSAVIYRLLSANTDSKLSLRAIFVAPFSFSVSRFRLHFSGFGQMCLFRCCWHCFGRCFIVLLSRKLTAIARLSVLQAVGSYHKTMRGA